MQIYRRGALRLASAYCTASKLVILVTDRVIPVALFAKEQQTMKRKRSWQGDCSKLEKREVGLLRYGRCTGTEDLRMVDCKINSKSQCQIARNCNEVRYNIIQFLSEHRYFHAYFHKKQKVPDVLEKMMIQNIHSLSVRGGYKSRDWRQNKAI